MDQDPVFELVHGGALHPGFLPSMAHEIPSQNRHRNPRHEHPHVRDAQMHAGVRQGNELARDGANAMSGQIQVKHRDQERGRNCRCHSCGRGDT
jgi:hypothetical protein